jgi:hypothetical protein
MRGLRGVDSIPVRHQTAGMRARAAVIGLLAVLALAAGAPAEQSAATTTNQALAIVQQAIARADQVKLPYWAYSITTIADGKKTIEHYDPSRERGKRWQLLLTESQEPSDKDRRKHGEERRRNGAGLANRKLGDFIDRSTLQIESHDAERIRCTFKFKATDESTRFVLDKLRGTLTVLREPAALEAVDVVNTGKISKPGVVSLNEIKINAKYQIHPERGDPLLHSCSSRIRGRILLVKSISSDLQITYADHRWIGPGAPRAR